jgi:SAM-dependent methyltransferase
MRGVTTARYDRIGHGYARTRRSDPRLRELIDEVLGDAVTVVDVGAGTGSYEPAGRHVIAIEPSDVMAAQRPRHLAPALRADAAHLPLRDCSVDAALAVLTVHHWGPDAEAGVRELRRVARGPVVIVTFDTAVTGQLWMIRDYLPEVAEQDRRDFPSLEQLGRWLGPGTLRVEPVPVFRDTPDWTFESLWAHPERALDPEVTAGTSGFARLAPAVRARALAALERDLASGEWDRRHGHLRSLDALDAGQRLLVHHPARTAAEEAVT